MKTPLGLELPEGTVIKWEEKRAYRDSDGQDYVHYSIRHTTIPLPGMRGLPFAQANCFFMRSSWFVYPDTDSEDGQVIHFVTRRAVVLARDVERLDRAIALGRIPIAEEGMPSWHVQEKDFTL